MFIFAYVCIQKPWKKSIGKMTVVGDGRCDWTKTGQGRNTTFHCIYLLYWFIFFGHVNILLIHKKEKEL